MQKKQKGRRRPEEDSMQKTTVIIPNYNGIKFIRGCLESLLAQDVPPSYYHIVVVDNGSTDGSRQLIEEAFPGVTLIALPGNTGFCHAVNVGIRRLSPSAPGCACGTGRS